MKRPKFAVQVNVHSLDDKISAYEGVMADVLAGRITGAEAKAVAVAIGRAPIRPQDPRPERLRRRLRA